MPKFGRLTCTFHVFNFAAEGLNGFANWMRVQWQEELSHAMKFFDYLVERGVQPILKPIAAVPKMEWPDACNGGNVKT